MSGFAQDIVFRSGDFTINDAITTTKIYGAGYAISVYNSYEGYLITSDGKINGNNLYNLDNVIQFISDLQTQTSTDLYTVKYYTMGTMEVVFKGNDKKYYFTPYVRKCITKAIKTYLAQ
jgi:hypothetical protein